ncbi:MAG: cobalamin biosynthesis protein CobD, partial [Deltaproteobacteria bacterium]|nr:cobalamin biosynthesis protein CobD [Deltaproteobacteria bacterium]
MDLILGDPRGGWHPVRLIGNAISALERSLRKRDLDGRKGGVCLVLLVQCLFLTAYLVVVWMLYQINHVVGLAFNLLLVYLFLAVKDLAVHVHPVSHALKAGDMEEARKRVAFIVGRDPNYLDSTGICRAAVESVAENFVDGILSPVFWFAAGGLLGHVIGASPVTWAVAFMLIFKIASTLDSMVGYKDETYAAFGWAGARLDDAMNYIPARLGIGVLFFGAWVTGMDARRGLIIARRDRLKHESPNSAHAESFFAGALGVRLGGPTRYPNGLKEKE